MWNKCSAVVESLAQDAFDPIFVESTSLGIWSLSRERASPPCMQCSNPCTLDGHPWSKIDCDKIFGLSWFRSSSRALQTMTMVQSHYVTQWRRSTQMPTIPFETRLFGALDPMLTTSPRCAVCTLCTWGMPTYTAALTSNSGQVGSNNWVKVYSEIVGRWQWMTKMDVGHGDTERPPVYHLTAGTAPSKNVLLLMVVRFGAFGVGPAGGYKDSGRKTFFPPCPIIVLPIGHLFLVALCWRCH